MTGLFRKCFAFVGVLVVLGVASVANASSYLRLDGVTVDPIQVNTFWHPEGNHQYTGPNLQPGVQAPGANLNAADLTLANLKGANLSGAGLSEADFGGADLTGAQLGGTHLSDTNFSGANLRNGDLSNSYSGVGMHFADLDATNANLSNINNLTGISDGRNSNFTNVDFTGSFFPRWGVLTNAIFVAADLSTATIDAAADFTGATYSTGSLSNRTLFPTGFDPVARGMVLVPEPGTVLLVGIGLAGMSAVSQRNHRRGTRTTRRD